MSFAFRIFAAFYLNRIYFWILMKQVVTPFVPKSEFMKTKYQL